jgi:hypothetical protein
MAATARRSFAPRMWASSGGGQRFGRVGRLPADQIVAVVVLGARMVKTPLMALMLTWRGAGAWKSWSAVTRGQLQNRRAAP